MLATRGMLTALWAATLPAMAMSITPMSTRIMGVVRTCTCGLALRMAMRVRQAARNWMTTPSVFTASTAQFRSLQATASAKVSTVLSAQSTVLSGSSRTSTPWRSAQRLPMAIAANQNQPLNWKCRNHWMLQ